MDGVTWSASPAVTTSRGAMPGVSAASCASWRSATKGRKSRSTPPLARRARSARGSRRSSSETIARGPPAAQVEAISWNETSKEREANWSVAAAPGSARSCHSTRFARARRVMATPFGRPVDPEV